MKNKKGIILGVANAKSIAWAIAQRLHQEGAHIVVSFQNRLFLRKMQTLINGLGEGVSTVICDVSKEEEIKRVRDEIVNQFGKIDFIVHSIAFAPREEFERRFIDTSCDGFRMSQGISVYSLVAILRNFEEVLNDGASVIAMTFQGSKLVVPGYNLMGLAKASLESAVRYLAYELGPRQIRVNAISAGPIATSAANWIPGFQEMLDHFKQVVPLRRNITKEEVANAAIFLLSDSASAITGEILYVDAGYHILAP